MVKHAECEDILDSLCKLPEKAWRPLDNGDFCCMCPRARTMLKSGNMLFRTFPVSTDIRQAVEEQYRALQQGNTPPSFICVYRNGINLLNSTHVWESNREQGSIIILLQGRMELTYERTDDFGVRTEDVATLTPGQGVWVQPTLTPRTTIRLVLDTVDSMMLVARTIRSKSEAKP